MLLCLNMACATDPKRIYVLPTARTLAAGSTAQFSVSLAGSTTWSVNGVPGGNPSLGTIDGAGRYTAPLVPPNPNQVIVSANVTVGSHLLLASAVVTIVNPRPHLKGFSPATAILGIPTVVTLQGAGFTPLSRIRVDGHEVATNFRSTSELTMVVDESVVTTAHVASVWVTTPAPRGGPSRKRELTVFAPGQVSPTRHPLVARYSFSSPREATLTVVFGSKGSLSLSTAAARILAGGSVDILVAGMKASSTYQMQALVRLPDGTLHRDLAHDFTTGNVDPERLPQISVNRSDRLTPTPGIELLDFTPSTTLKAVATDLDGNVIWFYDYENEQPVGGLPFPIKLLPNGHFLVVIGQTPANAANMVREIDLEGNTIRQFTLADLNRWLAASGSGIVADQIHHDILSLPNGHLILLANQTKALSGLAGFEGETNVQGDVIIDLSPDLKPVWTWSTFDRLDVNRHPWSLPDWTHGNALVYLPDDGNLLLSMRHQNWVIKIDYRNGQGFGDVLWRLGPGGDFTLVNGTDGNWFYAQHDPTVVSPNSRNPTLAVFDNGDQRPLADGQPCGTVAPAPCFSRLVILTLNEVSRTARLDWADKLPVFSFFGGSIQRFADEHVVAGLSATGPLSAPSSAALEVTEDAEPETVWRMDISGQYLYRALRLPSLYPGVQW